MTQISDYLENELLDHILNVGAYTAPAGTHVQLHDGDPGEAGTANPSATTTRQAASWAAAGSLAASTDAALNWTGMAADETLTHWSLWDASTGGNCLFYGTLTGGGVTAGGNFDIVSGDLTITLSGMFTTFLANEVLDHVLGNGTYTAPASLFVKAHLGAPGTAATANPAADTTRAAAGAFSAAVGGASDNDAAIEWTGLSADEDWSHISIWDASTSGNALIQGALGTTRSVSSGGNASFPAGALDLALQ